MSHVFCRQTNDVDYFKKEMLNPETTLTRKRAALWTLGHIGSSEYGFSLLQEYDVLKEIVNLAENSEILSLRGLGLICNSSEGRREVQKYNWMSSLSQGVSVCLPRDPKCLFKVSDYTFKGDLATRTDVWDRIDKFNLQLPLAGDEGEIIKLIGNL